MTRALIVVDVQRDFCEGGALAVKGGAEVAGRIYDYIKVYGSDYAAFAFTKDYHNAWPDTNGGHFDIKNPDYKNTWPIHCVAGSPMSDLHSNVKPGFNRARALRPTEVFLKGRGKPDYSGFQGYTHGGGTERRGVDLDSFLQKYSVHEVDIVGIAGDFCVRKTAFDAANLGYEVGLLPEMIASVGGPAATERTVEDVHELALDIAVHGMLD